MMEAKNRAEIDFDVSCGWRSQKEQKKKYKAGKSELDGVKNKSKHNANPSLAVDIYCYNGTKTDYDIQKIAYIAAIIYESAYDLGVKIKWGGTWLRDGKPWDTPHVELA
jgi:peptidoglycan L-alanyl-D-glutamate endopeptidase CwlK